MHFPFEFWSSQLFIIKSLCKYLTYRWHQRFSLPGAQKRIFRRDKHNFDSTSVKISQIHRQSCGFIHNKEIIESTISETTTGHRNLFVMGESKFTDKNIRNAQVSESEWHLLKTTYNHWATEKTYLWYSQIVSHLSISSIKTRKINPNEM